MFSLKSINFSILLMVLFLISCGGEKSDDTSPKSADKSKDSKLQERVDPMKDKGIGPIKEIDLPDEIDEKMVEEGKETYKNKCSSCHKPYKRYIGPKQSGLLERRTPEWIMNMILNPEEMTQKNPIANDLLKEYGSLMANQNITEDEARKILEYFRTLEEK